MITKIGIDVGNYDTKTQNTTTPSGYAVYSVQPQLTNEYLSYGGKYYAPTINRFPYVKDKTESDQALILSLFGIAKEVLYQAKQRAKAMGSPSAVQNLITQTSRIAIGVGLPVGDFTKFKEKTYRYYNDALGSGWTDLSYAGYRFHFTVSEISVFPQDLLPVAANTACSISHTYRKYLIMGIGGQTVDLIPVVDKNPVVEQCASLRLGVRQMFSEIIGSVETNFGETIQEDTVEEILKGEPSILPDEINLAVRKAAASHADKILNECIQRGFNFIEFPVVFFGGGGLLLRPYLENNPKLKKSEFLTDVNGNALYYTAFLKG